ncbi:MAG: 4-(cytidine 5'-diphospho)-2-C-methyl-D-erythritol kinase [Clostridia bacterium]|nr:4-(cytidine 5'-diphospho)-2-C-methyl-D-erythritol kinase [Clostridia bacterium]
MKKAKVNVCAKVNFTLDVGENQSGYHKIQSLVSSIDLCDEITVTKRQDRRITLKNVGIDPNCNVVDNNAYKTAKLFKEKYNTLGVDIVINKKIPVASGLGGSSADVAGVLKAMDLIFTGEHDLVSIANEIGSDCAYMLEGGWAVISGRGEQIQKINTNSKFYLILMTADGRISSREAYNEFDKQNIKTLSVTPKAVESLETDKKGEFIKNIRNDLYLASSAKVPEIKQNLELLSSVAPSLMSGSGSSVFAVFLDKNARDVAYKVLRKKYKDKIIKTQTV